jgi:uncharacterized protein YjbI with pentapeptide repeats
MMSLPIMFQPMPSSPQARLTRHLEHTVLKTSLHRSGYLSRCSIQKIVDASAKTIAQLESEVRNSPCAVSANTSFLLDRHAVLLNQKKKRLETLKVQHLKLLQLKPKAVLNGFDFKGFDLRYIDLSGVRLLATDFSDANLRGANLQGALLGGANLSNANLIDSNLSASSLFGANLTHANLTRANLSNANLTKANVMQANFNNSDTAGANFTKVIGRPM